MKIAISGTHRVGKTTLAEELLEQLPDYELVAEPYYALEEAGYVFSDIPDVDDFIKQFDHSVKQIAKSGAHVIFDRCPVDILAYIHALDRDKNIQTLFQTAQRMIEELDLLVFVPVETPDLMSGGQDALRLEVNDILLEWLGDFNVKTIEVKGSLAARGAQVLTLVR